MDNAKQQRDYLKTCMNLLFNANTPAPSLIIFVIVISAIFTGFNRLFISWGNLNSIINNLTFIGVLCVGMTIAIISGEFDLSIGSNVALCSVLVAKMFNYKLPLVVIIFVALFIGSLIGTLNGWLVTRVGINSIIATLGTMTMLKGVALLFAMAQPMIYHPTFSFLGRGYVFQVIPITAAYLIILLAIFSWLLKYSGFGRNIYFVGANPIAARLAGINVTKTKFIVFIISGIIAAFASIILTSQLSMGRPELGEGAELEVITIVVLGGISITGGTGNYFGVVIALILLTIIGNGMVLMDLPIFWRYVARGVILIIALLIDAWKARRRIALIKLKS